MFDPSKSLKKMLGGNLQVPSLMTGVGGPNDWDGDGIPNKKDCQPKNLSRQDNINPLTQDTINPYVSGFPKIIRRDINNGEIVFKPTFSKITPHGILKETVGSKTWEYYHNSKKKGEIYVDAIKRKNKIYWILSLKIGNNKAFDMREVNTKNDAIKYIRKTMDKIIKSF